MEYITKITLVSSDGQKFETNSKVCRRSKLINDSIGDKTEDLEFSLPKVKSNVLKKVLEYLEHYENLEPNEIEKPLKSINYMC